LRDFPWDTEFWTVDPREALIRGARVAISRGSALDQILPGPVNLGWFDPGKVARILVFAWYCHAILWWRHFFYRDEDRLYLLIYGLFLAFTVLKRWGTYYINAQPPLPWRRRLWTGRLIIPGYDVARVTPTIALLVGLVIPWLAWQRGWPWYAA